MEFTAWSDVRKRIKQKQYALLDLRSEGEFAKGAIPHAKNFPLLDNDERAAVGTLYKKEGKGPATRMGLELFADKAEQFLESCTSYFNGFDRVVIYCWRGGMRSRLVGMWLEAAGIPVMILEGGYKSFRTFVLHSLDELAQREFIVLNGLTGSGKTQLIKDMIMEGNSAIGFEGIANHRGSAFGGFAQAKPSPTQQGFENQLADIYLDLKQTNKILVELENNIGPVCLSKALRNALCASPMVYLDRDFDDRVIFLAQEYAENWNETEEKKFLLQAEQVKRFLSAEDFNKICECIRQRNFKAVITILLKNRYDKAYGKSQKRHQKQMIARFNISTDSASAKDYLRQYLAN